MKAVSLSTGANQHNTDTSPALTSSVRRCSEKCSSNNQITSRTNEREIHRAAWGLLNSPSKCPVAPSGQAGLDGAAVYFCVRQTGSSEFIDLTVTYCLSAPKYSALNDWGNKLWISWGEKTKPSKTKQKKLDINLSTFWDDALNTEL